MPQCEMCGKEVAAPTTVKVEGAEIQVCDDCKDFGTEVRQASSSAGSSKYSTSSSTGKATQSSGSSASTGSSGGAQRRRDMFDDMEEIAADYDSRIRQARESQGLTQEELANQLNEKVSLIRKLERGDVLPSDGVQQKLERKLAISLVEGVSDDEETEWESSGGSGTTTLGDIVKRKD